MQNKIRKTKIIGLLLFLTLTFLTTISFTSTILTSPHLTSPLNDKDNQVIETVVSLKNSDSSGTSNMWTWMSGNKTTAVYGVYGTKGVPNAANYPGSRRDMTSWTDLDGNLWLFGGDGYANEYNVGFLNDLWKYNLTSNTWTWMSGNKIDNEIGVYGTKGIPNTVNHPGSRFGMTSWTDLDGNLWLFGGYGYAESEGVSEYLNDLWKYDITSNTWMWMAGNKTIDVYGVYGTKGVANSANYPGSRIGMTSWTDLDGNLWMFGGSGYAESDADALNDLWKYDITSNTWTWMAGNKTIDIHGVYGTKGITDIANYPGSRVSMTSWTDLDGNLWMFGGEGFAESGWYSFLNDLWRYDIISNTWTWMSGNATIDVESIYGTKGIPDVANSPGGRSCMTSWTDLYGNLWMFGGVQYHESWQGWLNDLWRYNIISNTWTWISGNKESDTNGIYGTKGVPDTANYPGSRIFMASWEDLDGNLWIFGGDGYAANKDDFYFLNDLWRFELLLSTFEDDNYEENDVFTSAYNISNNENVWLSKINGQGLQFDEDWYEILADPSKIHLIIDLQFTNADGNIDLELYNSNGIDLITGSYSDNDNEYIDYILPSSGTYLLRIFGDNAGNIYDLYWNISSLNPYPFVLSTDANNPDSDGIFYLNWTTSLDANNYSIYTSNTTITGFDDSLTLIAQGLTNNSYLINTTHNGHFYYIVVVYNYYGNATSNSVDVLVDNSNYPSYNNRDYILLLLWLTLVNYYGYNEITVFLYFWYVALFSWFGII